MKRSERNRRMSWRLQWPGRRVFFALLGASLVWGGALSLHAFPPEPSAEPVILEFSSLATALPWEPAAGAIEESRVRLLGDREQIPAGRRWAEVLVALEPVEASGGPCVLTVQVDGMQPGVGRLAGTSAPVEAGRALVRVDLRTLGHSPVMLRCELHTAAGELLGWGVLPLNADPAEPLPEGTRIAIRLDIPPELRADARLPVTFGVPFPAGSLWSTDGLVLLDGKGKTLPAQWEPTARWAEDGALQWVRVDTLVAEESPLYVMVRNDSDETGEQEISSLQVRQTDDGWTVDTGPAKYRVGVDGALIKEARLDGRVAAYEGEGRGLYVVDQSGRLAQASAEGAKAKLEAEGPLTASVRIEGFYRTPEGEALAGHITRLEFFAGRPEVRATHTFILTRDTNETWFREVGWEFSLPPSPEPEALFGTYADDPGQSITVPLHGSQSVRMAQVEGQRLGLRPRAFSPEDTRWAVHAIGEDRFTLQAVDGDEVYPSGTLMGDWAAYRGAAAGWLLVCRDAARQHPKDFELSGRRATLRLFSPAGGETMDFRMPALMKRWGLAPWDEASREWPEEKAALHQPRYAAVAEHTSNAIGWSKTHQLLFAPLPAATAQAGAVEKTRLLGEEVMAHCDPQWIYETRALGALYPRDVSRFPVGEAVIEGSFRHYADRLPGPFTGFFDYYAGPHYDHPGRYRLTYTFLSDAWLLYARSGDRALRRLAQATNRAFLDNYIAHWEGPGKTHGLFLDARRRPQDTGKTEFPFYWEERTVFSLYTTSNLDRARLDYLLTGYRRGADIVNQFAAGMKETWDPYARDGRKILVLRLLLQAYAFTWDETLRRLVEKTAFDPDAHIYDPQGALLLSKERPYGSTTYKTWTDMDVFVELEKILGSRRAADIADRLGRYHWERGGIVSRATGVNAHALWERHREPMLAAGWDHFYRVSGALLLDPDEGLTRRMAWSQLARIFQGLPRAMDVLARTGADRTAPVSWLTFSLPDSGRLVLHKPADQALELLLRTPGAGPHGMETSGGAVLLTPPTDGPHVWAGHDVYQITEISSGAVRVSLPKDAPGGIYHLELTRAGDYDVFADRRVPMGLQAPQGWRTAALRPPRPVFFLIPEQDLPARMYFESDVRLTTPAGEPFHVGGSTTVTGWVTLPHEGLWSFETTDAGEVRAGFEAAVFSMGDPDLHPHDR